MLFAAGLGNHTTIVGFAPGMAIFALLTSPAFVLRWRTLVATAAILGIGLLQYAFILVRSLDPGAYVESRATTVAELIDVMMAGQFRDRLFTFSWRAILFDRLPFLFERVIIPELTWPALAAAVVGACWLLRRRLPAALLLLSGTAAILAFAVNYSVVDTPVFVIPAILVLWIAAAVGAEQAARVVESLERRVSVVRGWRAAALIAATTLLVPAWLLADNFAASDRSRETTSATYLDALFDALPERSALVHEDFLVDRMVMSRLLDEAFPTDRRVDLVNRNDVHVRRSLAAGHRVFGFRKSARRLRYDALDFGFAPVPLMGGPFNEFVSYLPRGAAIVLAVPTPHAARGLATDVSAAAVGGTATADLTIGGGQRIGNSGVVAPAAIEVHADAAGAVIRVGGRDVVRAFDGPAVAVFAPDGKLDDAFVLQADSNFRVPLPIGPLSIYPCAATGGARTSARTNGAMSPRRAGLEACCCRCPPAGRRCCMSLTIVRSSREHSTSRRIGSRLARSRSPRGSDPGDISTGSKSVFLDPVARRSCWRSVECPRMHSPGCGRRRQRLARPLYFPLIQQDCCGRPIADPKCC